MLYKTCDVSTLMMLEYGIVFFLYPDILSLLSICHFFALIVYLSIADSSTETVCWIWIGIRLCQWAISL